MTDNFIPIVSNTPPPIDDFGDDDDFQEYGVVNAEWDTGKAENFSNFTEPPSIFSDVYAENNSLSYTTCPSNSENPKTFPDKKIVTNENSDLPPNRIDINSSEDFFPDSHFGTSISSNNVCENEPVIDCSPPNSVDKINFTPRSNGGDQQNVHVVATERTARSRNSSPKDNLQLKDNLESGKSDADSPAKNSIDTAFLNSGCNFSENDKSLHCTPQAAMPAVQENMQIVTSFDISSGVELSDEKKVTSQRQINHNDDFSQSSKDFPSVDVFTKRDDDDYASFKQNLQSTNCPPVKDDAKLMHDADLSADMLASNEDDFADFASFDGSSLPDTSVADGEFNKSNSPTDSFANFSTQKNACQFDANFENFATFGSSPTQDGITKADDNSADDFDDFAKFEDNINKPAKPDADNFGDFGTAQFAPLSTVTSFTTKQYSPNDISRISRWFSYSASSDDSEDTITYIGQHVNKDFGAYEETSVDAGLKKTVTRPAELWYYLEDIDNAEALKFKWNSSINHQKLLHALGVNTQNVLFSGGNAPYYVPTYYAAGLGLLQPNANSKQGSNLTQTLSSKSPAAADSTVWKSETVSPSGEVNRVQEASPSPLENHMDASSINLDALDQVVKSSTKRTRSSRQDQDKLDPELLELAMTVTPDSSASKKPDPLSKILASLKISGRKNSETDDETLSEEATEVMRKLPDLSYMRSRVLMFPVSQSATN